jgi:hypothetical protein
MVFKPTVYSNFIAGEAQVLTTGKLLPPSQPIGGRLSEEALVLATKTLL